MKKLLFLVLCFITLGVSAQNNLGKSDDLGRIALAVYIPDQIEDMPVAAKGVLSSKLSQIISEKGLGGSSMNERFIITANINVMSKNITATAPSMHALSLDISLYIGDGLSGTKFASTSVSLKGVGENETKAYIAALKGLNSNSTIIQSFIESGKNRIIKYYNTQCDFIINDAKAFATQGRYEEAFIKLSDIPDVSKDCYDKARVALIPIYKKYIDKLCQTRLMEAKTVWAAKQNYDGATSAGEILAQIDPGSACYNDVKTFVSQITTSIKSKDTRKWNYVLREQQLKFDIVKAARDVGVAYGNGQAKTIVYNTRGWW